MGLEKNFENKIKKWLELQGIYPIGCPSNRMIKPAIGYYEKRWGGGYSKAGLPDLHIVVHSINIDVELKSMAGRPSKLQIHNIKQINDCGSVAFILYPDGIDNFKSMIKEVITQCNSHLAELKHLKTVHSNTRCATSME